MGWLWLTLLHINFESESIATLAIWRSTEDDVGSFGSSHSHGWSSTGKLCVTWPCFGSEGAQPLCPFGFGHSERSVTGDWLLDCLLIIAILVHSSSCKSTHSRGYNSGVDIPPSDAKISKVKKWSFAARCCCDLAGLRGELWRFLNETLWSLKSDMMFDYMIMLCYCVLLCVTVCSLKRKWRHHRTSSIWGYFRWYIFFQARLTVHMRKIGQVQLFGMDPGTWRADGGGYGVSSWRRNESTEGWKAGWLARFPDVMIFACVERQKSRKVDLVLSHPEWWKKVLERLHLLMVKYIHSYDTFEYI